MTEPVCNYTAEQLQRFIEYSRRAVADNISMYKTHDGRELLIINKGEYCLCMYEFVNGEWILVPPVRPSSAE